MTAIASGWFASVPTPKASAIGRRPTTVVRTVIKIGRRRIRPARGTATRRGAPRRRRAEADGEARRQRELAELPLELLRDRPEIASDGVGGDAHEALLVLALDLHRTR